MANGVFNPLERAIRGNRREQQATRQLDLREQQLAQQQQQFEAQEPLRRARQRLIEGQARRIERSLENVLDPTMVKSAIETFSLPENSSPLLRGATRQFALELGRVANRARTLSLAGDQAAGVNFETEMSEIRKELDTAVQQFNNAQQALADLQADNTDEMIANNPNLRAQAELAQDQMKQAQARITQNRRRIDQLLTTQLRTKNFEFQDQTQANPELTKNLINQVLSLKAALNQAGSTVTDTGGSSPDVQDVVDERNKRSPQGQF